MVNLLIHFESWLLYLFFSLNIPFILPTVPMLQPIIYIMFHWEYRCCQETALSSSSGQIKIYLYVLPSQPLLFSSWVSYLMQASLSLKDQVPCLLAFSRTLLLWLLTFSYTINLFFSTGSFASQTTLFLTYKSLLQLLDPYLAICKVIFLQWIIQSSNLYLLMKQATWASSGTQGNEARPHGRLFWELETIRDQDVFLSIHCFV